MPSPLAFFDVSDGGGVVGSSSVMPAYDPRAGRLAGGYDVGRGGILGGDVFTGGIYDFRMGGDGGSNLYRGDILGGGGTSIYRGDISSGGGTDIFRGDIPSGGGTDIIRGGGGAGTNYLGGTGGGAGTDYFGGAGGGDGTDYLGGGAPSGGGLDVWQGTVPSGGGIMAAPEDAFGEFNRRMSSKGTDGTRPNTVHEDDKLDALAARLSGLGYVEGSASRTPEQEAVISQTKKDILVDVSKKMVSGKTFDEAFNETLNEKGAGPTLKKGSQSNINDVTQSSGSQPPWQQCKQRGEPRGCDLSKPKKSKQGFCPVTW